MDSKVLMLPGLVLKLDILQLEVLAGPALCESFFTPGEKTQIPPSPDELQTQRKSQPSAGFFLSYLLKLIPVSPPLPQVVRVPAPRRSHGSSGDRCLPPAPSHSLPGCNNNSSGGGVRGSPMFSFQPLLSLQGEQHSGGRASLWQSRRAALHSLPSPAPILILFYFL